MNIKLKILLLLLFTAISTPIFSMEEVVVGPDLTKKSIGLKLEYFEDVSGKLLFQNVQSEEIKGRWIPSKKENLSFGFMNSVYWVRFTLKNKINSEKTIYLQQGYPLIDNIKIYRTGINKEIFETGDLMPFSSRPINHRTFVFPLKLKPRETAGFYVRYQTTSSMNIALKIWDVPEFQKESFNEYTFLMLYYGIILVMILYNLFVYFFIRRVEYLYYVLFVLFFVLFIMTQNGTAFQFLWPSFPWWANYCIPIFLCLLVIFSILFSAEFMEFKINSQLIYKFVNKLILLPMVVLVFLLSLFLPYKLAMPISAFITVLALLTAVSSSIKLSFNGVRPAKFYLISWTAFLIGALAYVFVSFGLLPNNFFTAWSIQIGSVFMVVLLSIAQADRINIMRRNLASLNIQLGKNIKELNTLYDSSNLILREKNIKDILDVLIKPLPYLYMFLFEKIENNYKYLAYAYNPDNFNNSLELKEFVRKMEQYIDQNQNLHDDEITELIKKEFGEEYYYRSSLLMNDEIGSIIYVGSTDVTNILPEQFNQVTSTNNLLTIFLENRKLVNERLQMIEHLKGLDKLKDEFLSNMSHEMNTPITSIMMISEMLKDGDIDKSDLASSYDQLYKDAVQLNVLVSNQMLAIKIESNEINPNIEKIHLNNLLEDIKVQLEIMKKTNNHKIKLPSKNFEIHTDSGLLKKILFELINNSLTFTTSGKDVNIQADQKGGDIIISVIDNGNGVPDNYLEKIKEKFFRVDSSITYKESGTGLGLYIADRLASILGGSLVLKNMEQGGFSATLKILTNQH